jgi:hypothetical protein
MLGKVFGSRDHAPINIAGTIIIVGVLGLLVTPFLPSPAGGDVAKLIGSLVLAAFTFLGGYLSGKRD